MQRAQFTGTVAEKRFIERKWCEKLRQAMSRVDKRKSSATARAVKTPVQEGLAADGGAACQRARLESARVRPPAREFGDVQGGAGREVPERGACAREEQGRETALAQVPAQGHMLVGAPRSAPEAVGEARQQDWQVHGGARGRARERDLDGL